MSKFKALVFDLDGTLLNTIEDIANAMNRVLSKNQLPTHTVYEYNFFVGLGMRELCRKAIAEDRRNEEYISYILKQMGDDYSQNCMVDTKPYDGIIELLDYASSKKLKMAVFSNKPDYLVKATVEHYFAEYSFSEVLGPKEGVPAKPEPVGGQIILKSLDVDADEVLYLGDTNTDMQTAKNCGFYPLGAEWGFRSKEELIDAGAKETFSRPSDLLSYLKEIL